MHSITHIPQKINNEIWKDIPGYVGSYQVSSHGRIRSVDRVLRNGQSRKGAVLKQKTSKAGYKYITLHKDMKTQCVRVHNLVMLAFVGPRPKGHDIHHIDNNGLNNHRENLMYLLKSIHQLTIDRPIGVRNGNAKLNTAKVVKIRSLYDSGHSQRTIAKAFGINQGTIHQIVTRKTWKHIK